MTVLNVCARIVFFSFFSTTFEFPAMKFFVSIHFLWPAGFSSATPIFVAPLGPNKNKNNEAWPENHMFPCGSGRKEEEYIDKDMTEHIGDATRINIE